MAYLDTSGVSSNKQTSPFQQLLMTDSIIPGSDPSYEICKLIYSYHPFGKKLIDEPLSIALSKSREISVQDSPENSVVEAFEKQWRFMQCEKYIENTMRLAAIYGIATLAFDVDGKNPLTGEKYTRNEAIPPEHLKDIDPIFHVFDPLNTAGSLVLDQNPHSKNFQRPISVSVSGETFHPSRCCVIMNEEPIYIQFTPSAYGFVGRSKFQRALFPLKSFINSMITDDVVQDKAALIVAKMKQPSSIVDNIMQKSSAIKRNILKDARTGNVISINIDEDVESINLNNLSDPITITRKNIIENIATASDVPTSILTGESFAQGFGEGTEDAKKESRYIDSVRQSMEPLFEFITQICMRKAWTPEFFQTIQQKFPEDYAGKTFESAFYQWSNSFKAKWPDLIEEREETRLKFEEIKLKGIETLLENLSPLLDPENRATLVSWAADNINELKMTFPNKLEINENLVKKHNINNLNDKMSMPNNFEQLKK